jgi:S-adenosylmethionine synthetase
MRKLFTSESVGRGHPDKVADQISDAIVDACLAKDPRSRVACEVLVTKETVVIAGEITSAAAIDYEAIARRVIKEIGYTEPGIGFDSHSCSISLYIQRQSTDIAAGVDQKQQGAGDQGLMFGYACDETDVLMPLPIHLSHSLMRELDRKRRNGECPFLLPDGKCQVTVEYDEEGNPSRVDTVVFSNQHREEVTHEELSHWIKKNLVQQVITDRWIDERTRYFINPTGRFVQGGPAADTGLTGRKIIVDSYGGMARHGGGAFSGKDPSKVDRSAAYAARHVAKHVVAAKWAKRCEIQIAYAIGVAEPVSLRVDTFGTGRYREDRIEEALLRCFDLTPRGIIEGLNLLQPIYYKTSFGGHFGRVDAGLPWEVLDRLDQLDDAINGL